MPELPEVETVRRTLETSVVGHVVARVNARRRDLRVPLPPGFEGALTGRRITSAARRAKYLMLGLDDGRVWLVHLGMSGQFIHLRAGDDGTDVHEHVVVELDDRSRLVFRDPRRFGLMLIVDATDFSLLCDIGPEPLDERLFDADYVVDLRARTKRTVKDVLMDQRVVAGLGNIYVNEILFLAGVRPTRRMSRLTRAECAAIVEATRTVIAEAIEHRGSSISDYVDGNGNPGAYQNRRRVYDRAEEPCPNCAAPIRCRIVGQRSSYYCPGCQR